MRTMHCFEARIAAGPGFSKLACVLAQSSDFELVPLANGAASVRSLMYGETCHPGLGPAAEAEALYVRQLRLPSRLAAPSGEFVVWDIGLGGAANALAVLRCATDAKARLRLLSFDHSLDPLRFAFARAARLGYFDGLEAVVEIFLRHGYSELNGAHWEFVPGDFPSSLKTPAADRWPKPHAILFDPFSPAKNPEMWTQPFFADLFARLDPGRPCALATYSRSTMVRASLLLAGFFVGRGQASGFKEETTVAANQPDLVAAPLDRYWLDHTRRSGSAEPLWTPEYRQARLSPETWERLARHPQFVGGTGLRQEGLWVGSRREES